MQKQIIFWIICTALSSTLLSLPTQNKTKLPIPEGLMASEIQALKEIIKLDLYTDSEDPNLFYFAPPFYVRQFEEGAAGLVMNVESIEGVAEARHNIKERTLYNQKRLLEFENDEATKKADVVKFEEKLERAMESGNQQLIDFIKERLAVRVEFHQKSLEDLNAAREIIKNGGTLLPQAISDSYNHLAILGLARAGFSVDFPGTVKAEDLHKTIDKTIIEAAMGYGGFLSFNAYAGFTEKELSALRSYKQQHHADLKIVLLPAENLNFFSLIEHQADAKAADAKTNSHGQNMFGEINGSGDYLGSTIVLNTTVSGASALAAHPSTLIVPVGIKATYQRQVLPVEAELVCDFSSGFMVQGRADVRDGLIIYDNDITNTISSEGFGNGACDIKHISGDKNSAEIVGLRELEKTYEDMRFKRIQLSQEEKKKYYDGVMRDIHNNRRQGSGKIYEWERVLTPFGWDWVLREAVSEAAGFHWHTNIQDMSNISSVKFNKRLSVGNGASEKFDIPLAPNLCLTYDAAKKAYDRCTDVEEGEAKNWQDAAHLALNSSECKNIASPIECGKKRDELGSVPRKGTARIQVEVVVDQI